MGRSTIAVFCLVMLLLLAACGGQQAPDSPAPLLKESRSFGLYKSGDLDQAITARMPVGERYARTFALTDMSVERDYVLVMLDNLKQAEFAVGGELRDHYIFHAEPGKAVSVPFELALAPGWHELVLLAFKQPGEASLDPEVRRRLTGVAASIRQVVIVGEGEAPELSAHLPGQLEPNDLLNGLTLSRTPTDLKAWPWTQANPGESLSVYPRIGNTEAHEEHWALVAFLDWQQVDLGQGEGPLVISVPGQTVATLEHVFTVPVQGETHEYQAVLIPDPFRLTDLTPPAEGAYRLAITTK